MKRKFVSFCLLSFILLVPVANFVPKLEVKPVCATLPDITSQEVTRPTTSGGEWNLYKVGDELCFQCGYLWTTKACRLWKTSDLGNTTPSWTLVRDAPVNITFWGNSYLTNDGKWLYGQVTNWTSGESGIYGYRLNVSSGSITRLTHEMVRLGWTNIKMNAFTEGNNKIYHANYADTTPPPDGSGGIGNMTHGGEHITMFWNMTEECDALHTHAVWYSLATERLYFSLDQGAGYIDTTNNRLTWIRGGSGVSNASSMCQEVEIGDETEIITGSDSTSETFVDRWTLDGTFLNKYSVEFADQHLYKKIFIHGDKAILAGNQIGMASNNHGIMLLSLVDGSYKWIKNSTDPNDAVVNIERFGNYIYFMWGAKLFMINLTDVALYDYTADSNNIQLRYLSGGTLDSFTYSSDKLKLTISDTSTSTTKVYCSDKGEPREVYSTNGTLSWSYNISTRILTLNVTHLSPARIVVYWRFPGDIDGDGDVDPSDFYVFAGAYGTSPPSNPECDFNGDGAVDPSDFYIFSRDYGKTEP